MDLIKLRDAFINLLTDEVNSIDLKPLFDEFLPRKGSLEMIEIIDNFHSSGDTELTAYPTSCGSDVCSHMNESKYFTLVGNKSKNYALLQLVSLPDQEVRIRFCNSIIPSPGVELNELNEIWRDPDALPF